MIETPSGGERTFQVGGCEIRVTSRSLADLGMSVDALVSSDDNYLTHGGGVSKALWLAAGEEEVLKSLENHPGKWSLGDVVVSGAGRLRADFILHAVTIDFDSNRRLSPPELGALYTRILATADSQGFQTVGLPLVAAGAGGITPHISVTVLVRSVVDFLASPGNIAVIIVAAPGKGFKVAAEAFEPLRTWDSSYWHLTTAAFRLLEQHSSLPQDFRVAVEELFGDPLSTHWPLRVALVLDQATEFVGEQGANSRRCNEARSVRNTLVHGGTQPRWTAEVNRALLDTFRLVEEKAASAPHDHAVSSAAEKSLSWLGIETKRLNRPSGRAPSGPLFEVPLETSASIVESRSEPVVTMGTALESETPREDNSHVRGLHRLMLDYLDGDARLKGSVDNELLGLGYQGDFELRLLEHCIRIDDPADLLTGTFDRPTLQDIYRDYVGEPASAATPSAELVREILYYVGFSRLTDCHGVKQVRDTIDRSEQLVRVKGVSAAAAVVHDVARQLEYLCHVLLRFIAKAAFGESPEMYLTRRQSIKQPGDLGRAGLGALLIFCEQVIDDLKTTEVPQALTLQRDLGAGALPRGRDALSSVRNAFSHFKPGAPAGSDTDALGFLKEARRFTTALASPDARLLPYVISIQSIHLDRWGRLTVKALNEDGMEETIFTDVSLTPGQVYLMYPLSNPLRVDPILVPAGDVIWKD
jgi:O-acetyl-ADP-ribose deacetylase (regulator of RNase III)